VRRDVRRVAALEHDAARGDRISKRRRVLFVAITAQMVRPLGVECDENMFIGFLAYLPA
jgi:hypothetical protein